MHDTRNAIQRDVLLDIVTHYWMTNTAGSSARLYPGFNQPDYRPLRRPSVSLSGELFFVAALAKTRYPIGDVQ